MTTQIRAELLIGLSNWQKGLTKANKQMSSFGKSMKTISQSINGALAFVGINALGDGLIDMAKAAAEDAASMAVLNKVLVNSWKATDEQTRAVDKFIQTTSVQVGILDDDLRPAFAKIATTIKNPTRAMEVFSLAIDVAAGTGKELNTVSLAMAKFFGGQTSALDKLVPGIKNAGDKVGYLTDKYKGAGAAGATAFDKLEVAMENIKEQLGSYLLPYIERFVSWLQTPGAQTTINEWVKKFGQLLEITEDIINGIIYYTSDARGKAMIRYQESQKGTNAQRQSSMQAFGGSYADAQKKLVSSGGGTKSGNTQIINIKSTMTANEIAAALTKRNKSLGLSGF
jgi:hypothetical protein